MVEALQELRSSRPFGALRDEVAELVRGRHVHRARLPRALPPPRWGLGELAGRLVEISSRGAALTVATGLVLEAQHAGDPVAWISGDSFFFPPDLAESGIDLAALAVIRPPLDLTGGLQAADRLLRSGAFGLVLLDLTRVHPACHTLPLAAQTRLAGLAQRHDTVMLCLTAREPGEASLGSLVSLHAVASRLEHDGRFSCEVRVLKDKRRGPGWRHREEGYLGPPGLR